MFRIYDGRDKFYQWDLDRKLIVADAAIIEVHFCNRVDGCSLVCETYQENGLTVVNVPNILLQNTWWLHVYAYDGTHTKVEELFKVEARTKPDDYVYTETELKTWEELENKIDNKINEVEEVETRLEEALEGIEDIESKIDNGLKEVENKVNSAVGEFAAMDRRITQLEYVAKENLYTNTELKGVGKEIKMPVGVLPYGSITSIGGMSHIGADGLIESAAVKYVVVKGRNKALLEPYNASAAKSLEFGSNYFKVKKVGSGFSASIYINGLTPGATYTMYLKTDIPMDQYNMYPNMSLNGTSQIKFSSSSIFRRVFQARDNGRRDMMTVYFNGANSAVATTYIEILEGDTTLPTAELFAPIHEDYIYTIPDEITNLAGYGCGVDRQKNTTTAYDYNYINFDEKAYYQKIYVREYKSGDENTWNYLTDKITTLHNDSSGSIAITDVSASLPSEGLIIPLVDNDTIIFSKTLGEELPLPIDYIVKYQIKV